VMHLHHRLHPTPQQAVDPVDQRHASDGAGRARPARRRRRPPEARPARRSRSPRSA
jgi:hypothetical protein